MHWKSKSEEKFHVTAAVYSELCQSTHDLTSVCLHRNRVKKMNWGPRVPQTGVFPVRIWLPSTSCRRHNLRSGLPQQPGSWSHDGGTVQGSVTIIKVWRRSEVTAYSLRRENTCSVASHSSAVGRTSILWKKWSCKWC